MTTRKHSITQVVDHSQYMAVRIIPVLNDSYTYLLIDKKKHEAAVIDPCDPTAVQAAVQGEQLKLTAILITHHHWDAVCGNAQLADAFPDTPFYGMDDRIPHLTNKVNDNQILKVGNLSVVCVRTPSPTQTHTCFYAKGNHNEPPALFTGKLLQILGCCKPLEATIAQTFEALHKLDSFPDNAKVYPSNEQTRSNLMFAMTLDPSNKRLHQLMDHVKDARKHYKPTVPSTIQQEKQLNPFWLAKNPRELAELRNKKDHFRPKQFMMMNGGSTPSPTGISASGTPIGNNSNSNKNSSSTSNGFLSVPNGHFSPTPTFSPAPTPSPTVDVHY